MNLNKQMLLVEYLLSSSDVFSTCVGIIKPEYFDPKIRKLVNFVVDYHERYNAIPNAEIIKVEVGFDVNKHDITYDMVNYCTAEVEQFCKRSAVINALRDCIPLVGNEESGVDDGNYGKIEQLIRDAMQVSLDYDLGIDYFHAPLERLEKMAVESSILPTGLIDFDDALGGGPARTEIVMFSANSGVGKSVTMNNFCLRHTRRGLNTLYISLEMGEDKVGQRSDIMISGIPSNPRHEWVERIGEIARSVEEFKVTPDPITGTLPGTFTIKRMGVGTTANEIRAYLKKYQMKHGYLPDVIALDYLDLMEPNGRVRYTNISDKDKATTEQLREIGFETNALIYTASQQTRGAIDQSTDELNQSVIAGGITKVNTVDVYISISATPLMKAQGQIAFTFLKSRSSSATGSTIHMTFDAVRLWIDNGLDAGFPLQRNKNSIPQVPVTQQTNNSVSKKTQRDNNRSLEELLSRTSRKQKS